MPYIPHISIERKMSKAHFTTLAAEALKLAFAGRK